MCEAKKDNICEHQQKLKGKPGECSLEQIKECHGDIKEHPCVEEGQTDTLVDLESKRRIIGYHVILEHTGDLPNECVGSSNIKIHRFAWRGSRLATDLCEAT